MPATDPTSLNEHLNNVVQKVGSAAEATTEPTGIPSKTNNFENIISSNKYVNKLKFNENAQRSQPGLKSEIATDRLDFWAVLFLAGQIFPGSADWSQTEGGAGSVG